MKEKYRNNYFDSYPSEKNYNDWLYERTRRIIEENESED